MVLQHNLPANGAKRRLSNNTAALHKSLEKLSSGFRINRAADDAAGLAISEAMRAKINGLSQAEENAKDGIGLIQTSEGALTEVHSMLQRGYQLSVQAANGTYNETARRDIDLEIQELKSEIDRISEKTEFNGIKLLNGTRYPFAIDVANGIAPSKVAELKNIIGNAGEKIMDTFSGLSSLINSSGASPAVVDGKIARLSDSVLAQAAGWVRSGKGYIKVDVDTSKFGESSSPDVGMQATIAHEMMHGVMGIVFNSLSQSPGVSHMDTNQIPLWFIEGTAQVAGGLFNANWNRDLRNATDTDQVKKYMRLNHDTPENEPYGTGGMAAAYIGQLAGGGGAFDRDKVVAGLNKVFTSMQSMSFADAVQDATGRSLSSILQDISPDPVSDDAAGFILGIANAAGNDGGGSFLNGVDLNKKVSEYGLDGTYTPNRFTVNFDVGEGGTAAGDVILQIGATKEETLHLYRVNMSTSGLGLENANVLTREEASKALESFQTAIDSTSNVRGYYGANQNRLEHTINNLRVTSENTTAAESRIRDTDMAKEMAKYTKDNILMQAAQSMLAQANQAPQSVLSLLQG
jgi:flagellin